MLLRVSEEESRSITAHCFRKSTLLKLFRKKAKKYSNINQTHCIIRPILLEISTLGEGSKDIEDEERGQKLGCQKQNKISN